MRCKKTSFRAHVWKKWEYKMVMLYERKRGNKMCNKKEITGSDIEKAAEDYMLKFLKDSPMLSFIRINAFEAGVEWALKNERK